METRAIMPFRARDLRRFNIGLWIAAGLALATQIGFGLDIAWAFPLFSGFAFAYELDRRQTWAKHGRRGDPRWARDWSPEVDPAYDLFALEPMRAREYGEARRLLEAALKTNLEGWRLATALYHLACTEALAGDHDAALEHLAEAIAADPNLLETAQTDDDFASIRDDPRFPRK